MYNGQLVKGWGGRELLCWCCLTSTLLYSRSFAIRVHTGLVVLNYYRLSGFTSVGVLASMLAKIYSAKLTSSCTVLSSTSLHTVPRWFEMFSVSLNVNG